MYFTYGSYTHDRGEILLSSYTVQRMKSKRNRIMFHRHTMTLMGEICVTGQDAIKSRLESIQSAYNVDGEDAILHHDDGTNSAHRMISNQSLNGVRVLTFDYPKGTDGEYVTGRTYRIVLQADYLVEEDSIYAFRENLVFMGNTGMKWELVPHFNGPPTSKVIYNQTPQKIVQTGQAVGLTGYPLLPGPLYAANYEHQDLRRVTYTNPSLLQRNKNLLYTVDYQYVFSSVTSQSGVPHEDYSSP